MSRVKRGVAAHRKHKKLLNEAEGRRGAKRKLVRPAREAAIHALSYAYRDLRARKAQFRALWIAHINAPPPGAGLTYSRLMPRAEGREAFWLGGRRKDMADVLGAVAARAGGEIAAAADEAALEAVRVRYLGRKDGEVTTRMKSVRALPAPERPAAGAALNR